MSSQPSPPPARPPPPAPTTISALSDDLLREIFVLLPDLPNLARAAFTCRAFLRAVRSSPAFRRRFRSLHAPPLLAFFLEHNLDAVPVFPSPWHRSDPGLVDAFRDTDFFQTSRMYGPHDDDDPGWGFATSINGDICISHRKQRAMYSPLTQALSLFPDRDIVSDGTYLEFHTLSSQEDQGLRRVVCIRHDRSWTRARVAVFSSQTMEWQIFPWVETRTLVPENKNLVNPGKVVDGFVYWIYPEGAGMLVLDTATSQFRRMDVPPPLKEAWMLITTFSLGQTKDGKLCIVHLNGEGIHNKEHMLCVWLWRKDDDGVERCILDKLFPLCKIVEVIKSSVVSHAKARIVAGIDGFVYLSVACGEDSDSPEWFLSFCLETAVLHQLVKSPCHTHIRDHPYVMPWPPLINSKEGSEAEATKNYVPDYRPVDTKEPSSILITALQTFKEALVNDDEANITETEAFFSIEDEKSSLMSKIATLDARLTNARDHILRLSADSAKSRRHCLDNKCRFCFLSELHR